MPKLPAINLIPQATYKAMGEALKTTTTISKRLEAICVYDGTDWLSSSVNEV